MVSSHLILRKKENNYTHKKIIFHKMLNYFSKKWKLFAWDHGEKYSITNHGDHLLIPSTVIMLVWTQVGNLLSDGEISGNAQSKDQSDIHNSLVWHVQLKQSTLLCGMFELINHKSCIVSADHFTKHVFFFFLHWLLIFQLAVGNMLEVNSPCSRMLHSLTFCQLNCYHMKMDLQAFQHYYTTLN